MNGKGRARRAAAAVVAAGTVAAGLALAPTIAASAAAAPRTHTESFRHDDSPLPAGAIKHIIVIDLENESESTTFGPD